MVKCRSMKRPQCMSRSWIYSCQWKSSRIRQQFYRSESLAMNTDTHTSGSMAKKPHLIKNGIRRQCNTENFVPIVVPGLSASSSSSSSTSTPMTSSTDNDHSDHPPAIVQAKVWIDKYGETRVLLRHQKSCWINQPKSQNQLSMRITNRYWETRILPSYRNGCKNSERILWMKEFLNTETHTRVLLMNHLLSPWEVWIWVSTVFILTSRKDRNGEICQRTKITRAPCKRRIGGAVLRAEKIWWFDYSRSRISQWRLWISKQSSICSRGARLGHPMDPVVSVQNKNFSGNTKELAKVLGAK